MSAVLNTPITHLYRQSISCVLASVLLASQLSADGIVVDTSAPSSHRPTMESSSNGIPLINIVTPNSTEKKEKGDRLLFVASQ